MPKIKLIITALALVIVQAVFAQGQRISGTVNDEFGPVMMANVTERDANNRIVTAAVTDVNGNFSMVIKNPNNKLSVSYVGAKTQTMAIGAKTRFNITMGSSATTVQEVTVTSKKRSNMGGMAIPEREVSVASQTMDMADVEGLSFTSADEALQGKIAGLDIVANSGNLGSGTQMRLRGITSINGSMDPLIVVDGQIFDTPDDFNAAEANDEDYASLLSVNVEDIASITVLKDAASTALWGSRGANGVIEITTKRGARGKTVVSYTYKFSGSWQPEGYKLLNGDNYTMMMKEAIYNRDQTADATTSLNELNYNTAWADYENWNNNTDWVDAVTQFGQKHSHSVTLSGGGEKANFRISAGYDHETGTIIEQSLNRFTTRMALDYFVSDRIKFTTNFAFTYTNNNQNYDKNILQRAQRVAPNMSIYQQDGNGNNTSSFYIPNANNMDTDLRSIASQGNPVAWAKLAWAKDNNYRVSPDFILQYDLLGIEEGKHRLTYKGDVYFDIYAQSKPSYLPAALSHDQWNASAQNYNRTYNYEYNRMGITVTNELMYTPYFKNQDWTGFARARYQFYTMSSDLQSETVSQLPNGIISTGANAYNVSASSSTSRSRTHNWSFYTHLSYKSRYSLDLNLRADGDSKFGPKNSWAYFPAISARWNISDEPFFEPLRKVVSMLAFRPSWGMVGNTPKNAMSYYEQYVLNNSSLYGSNMGIAYLDHLQADDLKWETTTSYNLGFNLGLFNDKIEAQFEYYYKKTTDLLMSNVAIPSTTGYASLSWQNAGAMTNEGWELNVDFNDIIKKGKFSLSANVNVSQNKNLITELDERILNSLNAATSIANGTYMTRVQVDNPLGSIYGLRYKGVYQYSYEYLENLATEGNWDAARYEAEVNKRLAQGETFPVATDANGRVIMESDGTPKRMVFHHGEADQTEFNGGDAIYEDINHDGQINELDVVYLGNSNPKVNGGFGLTFRYGNWTLRTSFNFRFGVKVVNLARMNLQSMSSANNQTSAVNYRWRKDGDITPMPRAVYGATSAYNYIGSDRYVEDASYVRFQYFQLTYNVPSKFVKSLGLNRCSFYLSGNNLFCWTKYSGTDPEHATSGFSYASDNSNTPRSKSFTAGVTVSF